MAHFVPFLLLGEGALKGEGEVQGQVACGSQRHIPCEPTHQSCFAAFFFYRALLHAGHASLQISDMRRAGAASPPPRPNPFSMTTDELKAELLQ